MRPFRLLPVFVSASALLAACATDGAPPPAAKVADATAAPAEEPLPPPPVMSARSQDELGVKPVIRSDLAPSGQSDHAAFLAGRAAMNQGRSDTAISYFSKAPGLQGDDYLRGRAFTAALMAGDVDHAAALAPTQPGDDAELYRLGRLTQAVEALAEGQGKQAQALMADDAVGYPHRAAAALLAPWAAAMAGDADGALARPEVAGDRLVEVFGQLGHAQIAERLGRLDEAEADYQALVSLRVAGGLFVLDYGAFLERRGRRADATTLYDGVLSAAPDDAPTLAAKARAAGRRKAPAMPTLAQGAANALTGPAASAVSDRHGQTAMAYLRLVLRLDPSRTDALQLVGDILLAGGDVEAARAAFERIPPSSAQYLSARTKLAWSYQNAGDKETALTLARQTAKTHPANADVQLTLADLLHADGRDAEAVTVLDGLVAKAGPTPDWRLLMRRATVLDAAGRWPEAERDLQAALKQRPDEPQLLNFLAFSWVQRGQNLPQALEMAKKAAAANPRSGPILDSLGWAYYRTGDYKAAVETLERAVLLEPGDPELNNHLGDAYWRVGRQDEARFQWRRVLTLEPDAATRADAEGKLKTGMAPPPSTIAAAQP
ncbi:MAG: hypothetical protein JWP35_3310 [Caulobacter sp.]|nr:hypothetical protein [Caulobacter sp.]